LTLAVSPRTWDKQRIAKVLQTDGKIPANLTGLLSRIAIGIVSSQSGFCNLLRVRDWHPPTFLAKEAGGFSKYRVKAVEKPGGMSIAGSKRNLLDCALRPSQQRSCLVQSQLHEIAR